MSCMHDRVLSAIEMSKVLIIRHLPRSLSLREKNELLQQFGAQKVWELSSNRDVVLASFSSHEAARASLSRLHQLEINKRRIVVEYSQENEAIKEKIYKDNTSVAAQNMKSFLKHLNGWNPSLDFFQPPPPNLLYIYPSPDASTYINILFEIVKNPQLYTQVLHLMNKMTLEPPFTPNKEAVSYFKEHFKSYFLTERTETEEIVSETESEISSEGELKVKQQTLPKIVKRKHMLPKMKKRVASVLSAGIIPQPKKKKVTDKIDNMFEEVNLHEPKKISLKVSQDTLTKQPVPVTQVIGEIKKLSREQSAETSKCLDESVTEVVNEVSLKVSKNHLLKNKISFNDMKVLPVFKNYHPGEPSLRLYLKNLAKSVKEEDVARIYARYIEGLPQIQQQMFDVRVMQEGRMKGQGFVTFPSQQIAQVALHETNGYLLNDKPMVVQFARVSNRKPINIP